MTPQPQLPAAAIATQAAEAYLSPPEGYEIETDAVTFGKPSYFWKSSAGRTGWHMSTRLEAIDSAWSHVTNQCNE